MTRAIITKVCFAAGALTLSLQLAAVALSDSLAPPVRSDGTDVGIAIMGAIVQKDVADNVALIKDSNGTVKAVKKDFVILDRYKVVAVHENFIELVTREAKRYFVYKDKFAADVAGKKKDSRAAMLGGVSEQYHEDGFERVKGKITMTAMYRDKLVKDDLAKVLMQATAEPFLEGGTIVGFKISQIDDGSIFSKAGISNGDVITAINGSELNSVAGSIALLRSLKGSDHLDLDVRRDGIAQKISVDVH